MSSLAERSLAAMHVLTTSAHLAGADELPRLAQRAGEELGALRTVLYVVDYDQLLMVPLLGAGQEDATLAVDGTLAGRAYTEVEQQITAAGDTTTIWAPLLDGTDRLGVLEIELPHTPEASAYDELSRTITSLAQQLAELVTLRAAYGDLIERARRTRQMSVAAELQWRLLPPLTFVSSQAAIAGVLLPTSDIAGDGFDYALNGSVLHVAILDAMGHGLEAALLSAVALSALRNGRSKGQTLAERALHADRELLQQFGPDRFVTGIVGELDTETGWWSWVTCGHPPTLVIRGGKVVKELDATTSPPLGLGLLGDGPQLGSEHLEPGDRLLLYTDGVVEARDAAGEFFGLERLVDFIARQSADGRPTAETLRRLNHAILAHQEGELQDDATTVLVEWLTAQPELSTPWPVAALRERPDAAGTGT